MQGKRTRCLEVALPSLVGETNAGILRCAQNDKQVKRQKDKQVKRQKDKRVKGRKDTRGTARAMGASGRRLA